MYYLYNFYYSLMLTQRQSIEISLFIILHIHYTFIIHSPISTRYNLLNPLKDEKWEEVGVN